VYAHLLFLDERRRIFRTRVSSVLMNGDTLFVHASPVSRRKEMCVVYARLLNLNERAHVTRVSSVSTKGSTFGAHRSLLVTTLNGSLVELEFMGIIVNISGKF
jgi:hypothetical protein